MSSFVVWMDSKEGKIFELSPEGKSVKHVRTHGAKHHHESHQQNLDGFYKELAESIKNAKEVVVIGPSDAKLHFKAYLGKHFTNTIAKKVVAFETVDHPTDNQILEHARKFFKAYDAFHS